MYIYICIYIILYIYVYNIVCIYICIIYIPMNYPHEVRAQVTSSVENSTTALATFKSAEWKSWQSPSSVRTTSQVSYGAMMRRRDGDVERGNHR